MKNIQLRPLIFAILLPVLSSCMAMGVPYTNDPHRMLAYSYEMMYQGRAIPAKNLADSAFAKYREQNDINGMAEALHTLGNLYKYDGFDSKIYNNEFTNYKKSKEYFHEALELFQKANNYEGIVKSQFEIASVHAIQGDFEEACKTYDKSDVYYKEMLKFAPEQEKRFNILSGHKNFPEVLKAFKFQFKCDE